MNRRHSDNTSAWQEFADEHQPETFFLGYVIDFPSGVALAGLLLWIAL